MEEFNICYGADGNYAEQLVVSMASVLQNSNKNEKFKFYILDGGLSDKDVEKISALRKIKPFSINFIQVNPNDFVTCPMLKDINPDFANYHVTLPTYFRFKLCDYFPNLNKILYLDCDVIVRSSLKELFDVDLTEYSACVVKDAENQKEADRLKLSSYFNAGVMLVNLEYWFQNNIPTLLFNCAVERRNDILWQDQDILNIVLNDSVKEIDSSWNFQYFLYHEENIEALSECKILHLAGKYKPWLIPFEHVVYDIYYKYLNLTAFSNREIIYRRESFGKFLTPDFADKNVVVGEIASGFDIQSVNYEISKSYDKLDALAEAIDKCYRYTEEKISEYSSMEENRVNDAVNRIYEEINKNYKYTEAQDSEYNDRLSEALFAKINEINSSVSKNSAFFEAYITESVSKLEYQTSDKIKNIINDLTCNFDVNTDEKIDKVYSEITNNYEFTKNIVSQNKSEILSYAEQKSEELLKLINNVAASVNNLVIPEVDQVLIDKLKNEYDSFRDKLREIPVSISDETDKKFDGVYNEIRKNAEYFKNRLNEALAASSFEFSQNSDKIRDELRSAVADIQSKISSDFIKNETQTALNFSEIKGEISKNHSVLISDMERLKSDLSDYFENCLKQSEAVSFSKIDGVLSSIEALNSFVNDKINGINSDINYFNELNAKNFADLRAIIDNAGIYTDSKFDYLNDVVNQKHVEVLDLIRVSEDNLKNYNDEIKNELDDKIRFVEKDFSVSTQNLAEKIYSVAIDFSKRTDELSKFFESKLTADLSDLSFKSNKKSVELKNDVLIKIEEKAQKVLSSQKKSEGEIYEFTNKNFKDLYDTFNSANSGLKENIDNKLEKICEDINVLKQKSDEMYTDISHKTSCAKDELTSIINEVTSRLEKNYCDKLLELEAEFDNKLNMQRIKYEKKIAALENKINSSERNFVNSKQNKSENFTSGILNKLKRVK